MELSSVLNLVARSTVSIVYDVVRVSVTYSRMVPQSVESENCGRSTDLHWRCSHGGSRRREQRWSRTRACRRVCGREIVPISARWIRFWPLQVCVGCRVAFLGLDVHIAARNHLSGVRVDQRGEDPFRVLCESVEHVQPPLAAEYRVFPCAIVLGCEFVEGVGTEPE